MDANEKKRGVFYYIKHVMIAIVIGVAGTVGLFALGIPAVFGLMSLIGWITGVRVSIGVSGP